MMWHCQGHHKVGQVHCQWIVTEQVLSQKWNIIIMCTRSLYQETKKIFIKIITFVQDSSKAMTVSHHF